MGWAQGAFKVLIMLSFDLRAEYMGVFNLRELIQLFTYDTYIVYIYVYDIYDIYIYSASVTVYKMNV